MPTEHTLHLYTIFDWYITSRCVTIAYTSFIYLFSFLHYFQGKKKKEKKSHPLDIGYEIQNLHWSAEVFTYISTVTEVNKQPY